MTSSDKTTGQKVRALMERAGLTVREFAKASGFNAGSGVQRYIEEHYEKAIKPDIALRFADALVGRGVPPIERAEVLGLIGVEESALVRRVPANAESVHFEGASSARMARDLPVFGTGLGGDLDVNGEAIEQTSLNSGETIDYVRRPTVLDGRADVYGLYVQGSSMVPVHTEGALVLVEKRRPPRVDDDVVVYLRINGEVDLEDNGESARRVLIKRLVRRSASYVELRQFNPDITFRIAADDILRIDRVLTLADLLG